MTKIGINGFGRIGRMVFRAALKNEVMYVPGGLCYADDPTRREPDCEMRISFGNASEEDIREGIRRLGEVLWKFF